MVSLRKGRTVVADPNCAQKSGARMSRGLSRPKPKCPRCQNVRSQNIRCQNVKSQNIIDRDWLTRSVCSTTQHSHVREQSVAVSENGTLCHGLLENKGPIFPMQRMSVTTHGIMFCRKSIPRDRDGQPVVNQWISRHGSTDSC